MYSHPGFMPFKCKSTARVQQVEIIVQIQKLALSWLVVLSKWQSYDNSADCEIVCLNIKMWKQLCSSMTCSFGNGIKLTFVVFTFRF